MASPKGYPSRHEVWNRALATDPSSLASMSSEPTLPLTEERLGIMTYIGAVVEMMVIPAATVLCIMSTKDGILTQC